MKLLVSRTIRATPQRLYEAWTTPEQLSRWWGPRGVRCSAAAIDARVGGRYRIDNLLPDGSTVSITGEFVELVPPTKLVFSWSTGHGDELVTVALQPVGDSTEVTVMHERIEDEERRKGHEVGWHGCLEGLAAYAA